MREYVIRDRQTAQHCGICFSGCRRRLNAVAALPRSPEKSRQLLVETTNQATVRNERTQTGPHMAGPAYIERRHVLYVIDRNRDIQLFSLDIVRRHRISIGR